MAYLHADLTPGVQEATGFWSNIEYERARADRNMGDFSMIVLQLEDPRLRHNKIKRITEIVLRRKRKIDRFGWIDHQHMGLLLSNTPKSGAVKVVQYLSDFLDREKFCVHVQLYSYPQDWLPELSKPLDARADIPDNPTDRHSDVPDGDGSSKRHGDSTNLFTNLLYNLYPAHLPWWKRSFDLLGAVLLLILCLPLIAIVGLFIKVVSPGPIFYHQERVGYLGRPFRLWKFRTMHVHSQPDDHRSYVASLIQSGKTMTKLDDGSDPRIIPMGKLLRTFGIDEIPQLFNIMRGEMSLIGPRPALSYEIREYSPWQKRRLETVPGLTGLWQVNGKNETTFIEMVRYDMSYSRNYSFWQDILILVKTIPAVLNQGFKSILKRKEQNDEKCN